MAIFGVKIHRYGQSYFFSGDPTLKISDKVMVLEDERPCLGQIVHGPYERVEYLQEDDLPLILRPVTASDLAEEAENNRLAEDAIAFCHSCIQMRQLDMKLVDVEVFFDRTKIIFFFIAPTRIDFRELVKDLVRRYHTRIELRQIGVRHETQMIGAVGSCGRVCCCRQYLRKFSPVSIQMAKLQHIFLNSGKISGTCGRLLCCLAYEQDTYDEFYAKSPRLNKIYHTKLGDLKVVGTNMYTGQVTTLADDGSERKFTLEAWADLNPTRVDGGRDDLDMDGSLEESLGIMPETYPGDALESLSSKDATEERAPLGQAEGSQETESLYYFPKNRTSIEKKPNYYQKMNPQVPLNLEERRVNQGNDTLSQAPNAKVVRPEAARVKEYLAGMVPILTQDLPFLSNTHYWRIKGGPFLDSLLASLETVDDPDLLPTRQNVTSEPNALPKNKPPLPAPRFSQSKPPFPLNIQAPASFVPKEAQTFNFSPNQENIKLQKNLDESLPKAPEAQGPYFDRTQQSPQQPWMGAAPKNQRVQPADRQPYYDASKPGTPPKGSRPWPSNNHVPWTKENEAPHHKGGDGLDQSRASHRPYPMAANNPHAQDKGRMPSRAQANYDPNYAHAPHGSVPRQNQPKPQAPTFMPLDLSAPTADQEYYAPKNYPQQNQSPKNQHPNQRQHENKTFGLPPQAQNKRSNQTPNGFVDPAFQPNDARHKGQAKQQPMASLQPNKAGHPHGQAPNKQFNQPPNKLAQRGHIREGDATTLQANQNIFEQPKAHLNYQPHQKPRWGQGQANFHDGAKPSPHNKAAKHPPVPGPKMQPDQTQTLPAHQLQLQPQGPGQYQGQGHPKPGPSKNFANDLPDKHNPAKYNQVGTFPKDDGQGAPFDLAMPNANINAGRGKTAGLDEQHKPNAQTQAHTKNQGKAKPNPKIDSQLSPKATERRLDKAESPALAKPDGTKSKHQEFFQMLDDLHDLGLEDNGKPDYSRKKKGYPAKALAKANKKNKPNPNKES
ncbi:MAG: hypothetical protein IJT59_05675 [Desulfovibrionaceae bacterium]|nr:hypothetical protein [Desulfovibrionaceae bacterium]